MSKPRKKPVRRSKQVVMNPIHIFAGITTAFATWYNVGLGSLLFIAYLAYEVADKIEKRDTLAKDILDFSVGLFAGFFVLMFFWLAKHINIP